ncbi:MAG TPA: hypothetical protein VGK02_04820 [Candidatus Aquicultor sp.]|jgi:hypothetical protein
MRTRRRGLARSNAKCHAWESMVEEGRKINRDFSKESELFVAKIDTLIASIVESKAA